MADEPFHGKASREAYITTFVVEQFRRGESRTAHDRRRMQTNLDLFQGKQDWGDWREDQEWTSRPFLHEFSKICRRFAEFLSATLFERSEEIFQVLPSDPDNTGEKELARIFEKIIAHDVENMKLKNLFYQFIIGAGCTGLGIFRVAPKQKKEYTGEAVIREIEKQEKRDLARANTSDVDIPKELPSEQVGLEEEIQKVIDSIPLFGAKNTARYERVIDATKKLTLIMSARNVDPRNFVFDPDADDPNESSYHIERLFRKIGDLKDDFDVGYLNPAKKDDLKGGGGKGLNSSSTVSVTGYEAQTYQTKDQMPEVDSYGSLSELLEYWGPLLDRDGDIIEENCHFIVANGKVLLRDAKNPFFSQKPPYEIVVLSKVPFKAYGQGVADNGTEQQMLINDLFATFIDMFKLAVYQPMVVDTSALQEPEEMEGGFYPGMVIPTFGKKADDVFSPVRYDTTAANLLPMVLNQLRVSATSAAGVDVTSANPSARSRISATEISSNDERASDSKFVTGLLLDEGFIVPVVQKIIAYRLQYGFEKAALQDLQSQGVLTEQEFSLLADIPPIERYNQIKQNTKIKVRGFRERIERQSVVNNFHVFLEHAGRVIPPEILNKIQWENVLEDYAVAVGFDAARFIVQNTPADKAREENRLLQVQQIVTNGENDVDAEELPVHFGAYTQQPTQELLEHIVGHLQRIAGQGQPLPEIPQEVLQAIPPQMLMQLGIAPEEQTNQGQRPVMQ